MEPGGRIIQPSLNVQRASRSRHEAPGPFRTCMFYRCCLADTLKEPSWMSWTALKSHLYLDFRAVHDPGRFLQSIGQTYDTVNIYKIYMYENRKIFMYRKNVFIQDSKKGVRSKHFLLSHLLISLHIQTCPTLTSLQLYETNTHYKTYKPSIKNICTTKCILYIKCTIYNSK